MIIKIIRKWQLKFMGPISRRHAIDKLVLCKKILGERSKERQSNVCEKHKQQDKTIVTPTSSKYQNIIFFFLVTLTSRHYQTREKIGKLWTAMSSLGQLSEGDHNTTKTEYKSVTFQLTSWLPDVMLFAFPLYSLKQKHPWIVKPAKNLYFST